MPKTKADQAFDTQLKFLFGEARKKPDPGPVMCIDQAAADRHRRELERPLPLDTGSLAQLLEQYGRYLELVGHGSSVGEERVFQFPAPIIEPELEPAS